VFSGIAIGFMGWGVWVHHMFAVGLGPVAVSAFSVTTMLIAVPTGVKIFNWIATMWRGSLRLHTPMLFAIGFVAMFTIGGLSGVTHAVSPHDRQQTDTYYIVAHFHYVLFGGSLFGIMAGIFYWWPKIFGYALSERLGKLQFWLWFIGFTATFGPFHLLGLAGMPRRIYTYPKGMGWDMWNLVASIGAFIIAFSVLIFLYNVWHSNKVRTPVSDDPWDARTLEWTLDTPPAPYNFAVVPTVHSVDEFWHQKYTEDDEGRLVKLPPKEETAHDVDPASIHLPSPSYFPMIAAFGLPVMAYAMIYSAYLVAVVGGIIIIGALYAWALEPSAEPHDPHADHAEPEPPPPDAEPAEPAEPAELEEVSS
jgi:cytochrome c oxidase subunit 1